MKIVELYIHSQDVLKVEGEHRKGSSGVRLLRSGAGRYSPR